MLAFSGILVEALSYTVKDVITSFYGTVGVLMSIPLVCMQLFLQTWNWSCQDMLYSRLAYDVLLRGAVGDAVNRCPLHTFWD